MPELISILAGYVSPDGLFSPEHEPMCAKEAMLRKYLSRETLDLDVKIWWCERTVEESYLVCRVYIYVCMYYECTLSAAAAAI